MPWETWYDVEHGKPFSVYVYINALFLICSNINYTEVR